MKYRAVLAAIVVLAGAALQVGAAAALPTIDQSVPMEKQAGVFVVPVLVNGAIRLKFAVDSGASDVNIPADVFLTLLRTGTIQASDHLGTRTYTAADGSAVPSELFRIRTLQVGDVRLDNVVASVGPTKGDPLLGQSFLSRFSSWSINNEGPSLILRTAAPTAARAPVAAGSAPPATASVQTSHADAGAGAPGKPCGVIQKDDGVQLVPCRPSRSALQ